MKKVVKKIGADYVKNLGKMFHHPIYKTTYWYFDLRFEEKSRKNYPDLYNKSEYNHPFMSKTVPRGKDYVIWRYKYPDYKYPEKLFNKEVPLKEAIEKTNGVHQVIYKGKVIKEFGETGICKNDAMIMYHVKKLIHELLKQDFDDKKLYAHVKERSVGACEPRYEDISGMNLFTKRMIE